MSTSCTEILKRLQQSIIHDMGSDEYVNYQKRLMTKETTLRDLTFRIHNIQRELKQAQTSGEAEVLEAMLAEAKDIYDNTAAIEVRRPELASDLFRGMDLTCMNCPTSISLSGSSLQADLENIKQTNTCIAQKTVMNPSTTPGPVDDTIDDDRVAKNLQDESSTVGIKVSQTEDPGTEATDHINETTKGSDGVGGAVFTGSTGTDETGLQKKESGIAGLQEKNGAVRSSSGDGDTSKMDDGHSGIGVVAISVFGVVIMLLIGAFAMFIYDKVKPRDRSP